MTFFARILALLLLAPLVLPGGVCLCEVSGYDLCSRNHPQRVVTKPVAKPAAKKTCCGRCQASQIASAERGQAIGEPQPAPAPVDCLSVIPKCERLADAGSVHVDFPPKSFVVMGRFLPTIPMTVPDPGRSSTPVPIVISHCSMQI
jgi:hypothetical protein